MGWIIEVGVLVAVAVSFVVGILVGQQIQIRRCERAHPWRATRTRGPAAPTPPLHPPGWERGCPWCRGRRSRGRSMTETTSGPAAMAGPEQGLPGMGGGASLVKDESTVAQVFQFRAGTTVPQLVNWEHQVRELLEHYQREVDDLAEWRRRIVQCLHTVHGLSYQKIADELGNVTRSRVEQIAKGRTR